jgi:hypothetical protein
METALRVMSPPGLLNLSLFSEITGFPTPLTAFLHKGNISLSLQAIESDINRYD